MKYDRLKAKSLDMMKALDDKTRLEYLSLAGFKKDSRPTVLRTLEQQIEPEHTALLIIDVQNHFVHPELTLFKPDGLGAQSTGNFWESSPLIPRMLEKLPHLLEAARRAKLLVVFIRAIYDPKYLSDPWAFILERKGIYGDICISGSKGADFYEGIRPNESTREVVVTKHRLSAFWGTDLDQVLRSNGIKTVVMTGTATAGCVESTTRDALFADYYTVTVEDCVAQADETSHYSSLRMMAMSYGFVVSSEVLINIWAREKVHSTGQ